MGEYAKVISKGSRVTRQTGQSLEKDIEIKFEKISEKNSLSKKEKKKVKPINKKSFESENLKRKKKLTKLKDLNNLEDEEKKEEESTIGIIIFLNL